MNVMLDPKPSPFEVSGHDVPVSWRLLEGFSDPHLKEYR
jgi:hypothetical protein